MNLALITAQNYLKLNSHICQFKNLTLFRIQRRNFISIVRKIFFPTDRDLKELDNVESHYQIVYKGDSAILLKNGYKVMLGGTGLLISVPVLRYLTNIGNMVNFDLDIETGFQFAILFSFYLAILIIYHRLATAYVYRFYYSDVDDKYLVILMNGNPFAREKKLEINPGDIKPYNLSPIYKNLLESDIIFVTPNKTKLVLFKNRFGTAVYYNRLFKR